MYQLYRFGTRLSSYGTNFVIVGAGTAGCVLANRLSENPDVQVTLIEAGGPATDPSIMDPKQWPYLTGSGVDWGYRTVPQPHTDGRVHDWPRGKVMGGDQQHQCHGSCSRASQRF